MKRKATRHLGTISSESKPVLVDQFDSAICFLKNDGASTATFHFEAGYEREGTKHWARLGNYDVPLSADSSMALPVGCTYDLSQEQIASPSRYSPQEFRVVKDSGPDLEASVVLLRLCV